MGFSQTGSHSFFMGDEEQTDIIMVKKNYNNQKKLSSLYQDILKSIEYKFLNSKRGTTKC